MMLMGILVTVVLAPLLLLVALGKGDNLIAGYNTSSENERKRYDIKRLRCVIATSMLLVIVVYWLPYIFTMCGIYIARDESMVFTILLCIIITFATIIMANTWAKRK